MSVALAGGLSAGVLAAPAGGASKVSRVTASIPDCASSFDPYAYTQAALAACGYQTFSQTAVNAMAGGGTSYDYMVNGNRVRVYVPPEGFDPATASDAQLDEYGFPPRPAAGSAALTQWNTQMSNWKGAVTPPPFLVESNATSDSKQSYNWSGYAVTGGYTYTHAEAWWIEPTYYSSVCPTTDESTWAGIGGYFGKGDDLGQNGTAHGVPGISSDEAWWEVVPGLNMMPILFYAHTGSEFDASTRWLGSAYRFYFYDYYSGNTYAMDYSTSTYSGDSAEAIAERPTVNYQGTDLSNFGTLTFEQTQANGSDFDTFNPNGVRHGIYMTDSSLRVMADPSTIWSPGYFTDTQERCN